MEEVWKICPNTNDKYEVSDLGRVRRVKGLVRTDFKGGFREVGGNTLSQKTKTNGYKEVNLYYETNTSKMMYVHRLVAMTFIAAIPPNHVINHKYGDKTNNKVENLEIVTYSENMMHSSRVLGNKAPIFKGIESSLAKVTDEDVLEIRRLRSEGVFYKDISAKFNISIGNIGNICRGDTWKHLL